MKTTIHIEDVIKDYQCPRCVAGCDLERYEPGDEQDMGCRNHVAGTMGSGIGKFFLGMPTGFCRLGVYDKMPINIFCTIERGWEYTKFNVPVWKHLNEDGFTIVRGLCPRTNWAFLHIFLENCLDDIDCLEITKKDLSEMD